MVVKKWGPLFALLALTAISFTGLLVQNTKPHSQTQPTKTEKRDSPAAKAVADVASNQNNKKGNQENNWYEPFFEKPTDTLLVIFNGMLALFTWRLYAATKGLFTETAGLREATDRLYLAGEEQLKVSSKAADAARAAVELSDKTAEHQLRAYVFVREAFIRNLDGPDAPVVHIYVKNYGQTPAYKYVNAGAVRFTLFPNENFSRDPNGDQRLAITTLPPGGESTIVCNLPFIITPELKVDLKAGKLAIYAFGKLKYVDAFKKDRVENYRFIFGGDAGTRMFEREGVRLGAMAQTIEGNGPEDQV